MPGCRGGGFAAALLLLVVADSIEVRWSHARELRPSDHGLSYQGSPPDSQTSSPEMLTFFGTSSSPPSPSAPAPHPPSVALPRAMNSSDATLWSEQQQEKPSSSSSSSASLSSSSRSSDRVMKEGLLIGSLVCGIIGVALLAASAFIFLFYTAKKPTSRSLPPSSAAATQPHAEHHDHNNAAASVQPAT